MQQEQPCRDRAPREPGWWILTTCRPEDAAQPGRNGRKAKDHRVDRTPYQGDCKISYVSYNTRAISMGITKAESRTLIDAAHHAKGRLCRMRVGAPAALA